MKGRTFSVILTSLALLLLTGMGASGQHEGHQMPAQTVKKKTPSKKTTARSSVRNGKTTSRTNQAIKAAPQSTKTKDAPQPHTMDNPTMDIRQLGAAGASMMNEQSRHALVVTYAHSIGTFAKTLRDRVQSTEKVDAGFAFSIVDEMKRSLDAIEQQHREHSALAPVRAQSQMSTMMKEMRISALRQTLTALERDLQAEGPGPGTVLRRADEIVRLSGVPAGTTHQHGKRTKPDDEQSVTTLDQRNDMKEGAAVYTCSMHPEVRFDKPGKCPKCGMTLVKRKGS